MEYSLFFFKHKKEMGMKIELESMQDVLDFGGMVLGNAVVQNKIPPENMHAEVTADDDFGVALSRLKKLRNDEKITIVGVGKETFANLNDIKLILQDETALNLLRNEIEDTGKWDQKTAEDVLGNITDGAVEMLPEAKEMVGNGKIPNPPEDDDGKIPNPPEDDSKGVPDPPGDLELDNEGTPWNAKYHSRGKSKMVSGVWKKKRGIDLKDYEKWKSGAKTKSVFDEMIAAFGECLTAGKVTADYLNTKAQALGCQTIAELKERPKDCLTIITTLENALR